MTHTSLKPTIHSFLNNLPFLDLWIKLESRRFLFNCHQKALNTYEYIPFTSTYPNHVKTSFISYELKWSMVRESTPIGYDNMKKLFYHRLWTRGYPEDFILKHLKKYPYSLRPTLLFKPNTQQTTSPIIFRPQNT